MLWGMGHSGSQAVGGDEPNSIQPGVFFGKGFGDLPDAFAWLRPFAVTGAFVDEFPFGTTTTALGLNSATGKLQSTLVPTVETAARGIRCCFHLPGSVARSLRPRPAKEA
jgi:hypothetical protein